MTSKKVFKFKGISLFFRHRKRNKKILKEYHAKWLENKL